MQVFKRALVWLVVGAAMGMAVTAALAPGLISWWYAPPVGAGLDCAPAVDWALAQLVRAEVFVASLSGLVALVIGLVRGKTTAIVPAAPAPPPPG